MKLELSNFVQREITLSLAKRMTNHPYKRLCYRRGTRDALVSRNYAITKYPI